MNSPPPDPNLRRGKQTTLSYYVVLLCHTTCPPNFYCVPFFTFFLCICLLLQCNLFSAALRAPSWDFSELHYSFTLCSTLIFYPVGFPPTFTPCQICPLSSWQKLLTLERGCTHLWKQPKHSNRRWMGLQVQSQDKTFLCAESCVGIKICSMYYVPTYSQICTVRPPYI